MTQGNCEADLEELFPLELDDLSQIEVDDETIARIWRKVEISMLASNERFLQALRRVKVK